AASAAALLVQAALVGRVLRALRDGARDQARARGQAALAHRVAALLLALAAIGMATARYLPPSGTAAADALERFADSRACALPVVSLHSLPRGGTGASIIGMVCRCAVPFFLIASGYLQNPPERLALQVLSRPLWRLLPIYLFWMAVYYAVAGVSGIKPVHLD